MPFLAASRHEHHCLVCPFFHLTDKSFNGFGDGLADVSILAGERRPFVAQADGIIDNQHLPIAGQPVPRLLASHRIILSGDDLPFSAPLQPGIRPGQTVLRFGAVLFLADTALVAVSDRQRIPEQPDLYLLELAIRIIAFSSP